MVRDKAWRDAPDPDRPGSASAARIGVRAGPRRLRRLALCGWVAIGLACAGVPGEATEAPEIPAEPAPERDGATAPRNLKRILGKVYAPYTGPGDPAPASWLRFASTDLSERFAHATEDTERCGVLPVSAFDPIVGAQDWQLSDLEPSIQRGGDTARGTMRFLNFGEATEVVFAFVLEDGAWRIDDVVSSGSSLRDRIDASEAAKPCR